MNCKSHLLHWAGAVFILTPLGPRAARAQEAFAATVSGVVTDPTDAVIFHADVHLSGKAPNGSRVDGLTDHTGHFEFRVSPGTYTVTVTSEGFEAFTSRSLVLGSGEQIRLPVHLIVAGRPEHLDVNMGLGPDSGGADNGQDLVFEGNALGLLSDDPATLQRQLNALAGGLPAGPEIVVNGFSNGRLPPKSSIRSIRINRNPYSAYYDTRGLGRVEIETKPGTDKLHGELDLSGTDQPLNARNPYTAVRPPFYQFAADGNLNAPISKDTSFFLAGTVQQIANNAVVNAVVLNPLFAPSTVSEALPAPQHADTFSLRVDRQFSPGNFGYVRDEWSRTHILNSGIDPLVLPEAAFTSDTLQNSLQAVDTQILGPHAVNQTRFQYMRTRARQDPNSTATSVLVEGSFLGGGSPAQVLRDNQDRYEVQDLLEFDRGQHAFRAGGRFRALRDANDSSANFNGQYVFGSRTVGQNTLSGLDAYQVTLQGLAAHLTPDQIRASGGGASQFSVTVGEPSAALYTSDTGLFAEDDWKLTKNITLSYGLRFESQSAIPDHLDPAPRLGIAWAVHHGRSATPLITLRGGYGVFYDRFPAPQLLQSVRQNGLSEIGYFAQNPDTYPNLPSTSELEASQPTVYRVNPSLRSSYQQIASVSANRTIGNKGVVSAIVRFDHGTHGYLTRNINAPLPGTYNPADPNSGTRPLGAAQNIYQYSSDSNYNAALFSTNAALQLMPSLYVFGVYVAEHERDEGFGVTSFPSNQYNLRADYAVGTMSYAQRFEGGFIWTLPKGLQVQPFLSTHTGLPFDIITGTDLNGDTIFNDRPAFATDLTRSSVVNTRFGAFDASPLPGQRIIPRNYGSPPGFVWLDLQASKEFHLGPRPGTKSITSMAGTQAGQAAGKQDRPWELKFKVEAQNVLNHTNPGQPVGVLNSPYFGRSLSLANEFSPLSAANRTVLLQSLFTF